MIHSSAEEKRNKMPKADAPVGAIELLKNQHREVGALFKKFDDTGSKATKTREKIFLELASMLEAHTSIEEEFLYPKAKSVDADLTLEAFEEHTIVKDLIKKTRSMDPSDETYFAKVTVLKELVHHHVQEEEKIFFPELKQAFDKDMMLDLGTKMKDKFEDLIKGGSSDSNDRKDSMNGSSLKH
jgi:hemerythrin superfamily protein